jgi:hypothetical protein
MTNDISTALAAARNLTERLATLRGMECYGDLMEAANSLLAQISNLSSMVASSAQKELALSDTIEQLRKENKALYDWNLTAKNYELQDIGRGVFAQVYRHEEGNLKPSHWACAHCFEDHKISVLQRDMPLKYVCPRCKHSIDGRLVSSSLSS